MRAVELWRRFSCEARKPFLKLLNGNKVSYGKNFYFRKGLFLNVPKGGNVVIGDNVFFNRGCSINCRQSVSIGDGSTFGEGVKIYDHDHDFRNVSNSGFICAPIRIGNNCWIGSGVIILKGVTIGDNSVIAAGSTVFRDVPENTVAFCRQHLECRPRYEKEAQ